MSAAAKPQTKAAKEGSAKKGGKKKLIILAVPLLLIGVGAGLWFTGILPNLLGMGHGEKHGDKPAEKHAEKPAGENRGTAHGEQKADKSAAAGSSLFLDLPDIVANLNTGPRRATYVKLRAKLELSRPEDGPTVQAAMPRVLDLFQGYLREMRPEELRGTAGTYRLREELLARTNLVAPPARVVAVLFTEIIVQ